MTDGAKFQFEFTNLSNGYPHSRLHVFTNLLVHGRSIPFYLSNAKKLQIRKWTRSYFSHEFYCIFQLYFRVYQEHV